MQARLQAFIAAKAERRAASAALTQVEAGIHYHAQQKNFDKLREVASASSIATKVNFLTYLAWTIFACARIPWSHLGLIGTLYTL